MKICLKCGMPCVGTPIVESLEDEPVELDIFSDCCLVDFEEVDEDHVEDLSLGWRYGTLEADDLNDLDRLILEAQMYEV